MAVNASKVRDPRYWAKWHKVGALGKLSKPNGISASKENLPKVIAVYEYTKGSYQGGRFIVYHDAEEIDRIKQEQDAPDSNTKIVAIGISLEQAQAMCHDALLNSGVISNRIKNLADDPDVSQEVLGMEAANLLLAAKWGLQE